MTFCLFTHLASYTLCGVRISLEPTDTGVAGTTATLSEESKHPFNRNFTQNCVRIVNKYIGTVRRKMI